MFARSIPDQFTKARLAASWRVALTGEQRSSAAVAIIGTASAAIALAGIVLFPAMGEAAPVAAALACACVAALLFLRAGLGRGLVAPLIHILAAACAAIFAADHPLIVMLIFAALMALWTMIMSAPAAVDSQTGADAAAQPATPSSKPGMVLSASGSVIHAGNAPLIPGLSIGAIVVNLVHVNDRISWLNALGETAEGHPTTTTIRLDGATIGKAQSFRQVTAHLSPLADGTIGLAFADRSEAANTAPVAQAPSAQAAAQQYLAMASHELRTPLNAIIGFSDILRSDLIALMPDARKREYVELIHNAGTHLLSIVNTILDVSKIEAGHYTVNREPFDLAATVREAVAMVATRASAKDIHLNVRMPDDLALAVADRRAVKQILINLLSNAVKFTQERGCVTVDAKVSDQSLFIQVADTGIGMSADELETVGQPFTQVDNSYTRSCEGTGLGLALVKGLVRLQDGTFEIESERDVGTCVTVAIPFHAQSHSSVVTPLHAVPRKQAGGTDHESLRFG